MSRISVRFSTYVIGHFFKWFLVIFFGLAVIMALGDLLEFMRQGTAEKIGITQLMGLALLKLPSGVQRLLPFVVFFATIVSLWRMSRSSELIAARSLGISAKQFIQPIILVAIAIAVVKVAVFNPIAASTYKKFITREAELFPFHHTTGQINANRLWLREASNSSPGDHSATIIHAHSTTPDLAELRLVTVMQFDREGNFTSRLDAQRAILQDGRWHFSEVSRTLTGQVPQPSPDFILPTEFTPEKISLSLSIPETLSFWELPTMIGLNENAGLPALPQRMAWQNEWATPVLFTAMILIGTIFSLRLPRRGKVGMTIGIGIGIGFIFYFIINLIQAFGLSGRIPVVLAVWSFPVATCMVGIALLLHLEDG
ncbi:MAG: LPS export ABC transporter permease LptG [Candidatus Pacebacteria bacterium]|nr:LPS export ABC transporter permease LptG [Candidatus Paceibacterota bacterium]